MRRATSAVLLTALLATACQSDPELAGVSPEAQASQSTDAAPGRPTSGASESGDETSGAGGAGPLAQPGGTPAFAPAEPGRGETRDQPRLVGQAGRVGDDWHVRVVGYDPDATAEVLEFNAQNQPPPEGQVMALARIEATFLGEGSANAFLEMEWALVDDAGTLYTDSECGVLPDDLASQSGVPRGQSANGTICFAVDESALGEVVLHIAPLLGKPVTRRWWQARPTGAGIVLE